MGYRLQSSRVLVMKSQWEPSEFVLGYTMDKCPGGNVSRDVIGSVRRSSSQIDSTCIRNVNGDGWMDRR